MKLYSAHITDPAQPTLPAKAGPVNVYLALEVDELVKRLRMQITELESELIDAQNENRD